jgi:glycosyltransferase involved in cell wall biosynthesis
MPKPFSVVILTLNEEQNLPRCLQSITDCQDILIVDSGSTDRTVTIAREHGARVIENSFENFAQQRNFALQRGDLLHEWVFHLDADETFTPGLLAECANHQPDNSVDGVWVAPRMMWRNTWLKRCTDFPAWQARFVHRDRFRFIEVGHGQREAPDMRMTKFHANYLHDLSADGVDGWLEKHRRYAAAAAATFLASPPVPLSHLWSAPPLQRRRALKHISYHLPFRPLFRFLYQYLLRGGFLDGAAAWEYCTLLARYEGFAAAEIRTQRSQALSVPK